MIRDDFIRMRMAERRINQTELAQMANLSRATVNGIVNGKTADIKVPTLKAIADALGIPLRDLFTFDEQRAA